MNNNLEELITALYDMIQDAKSVPLSSDKCIIERDKALDMLDDLSAQLPGELLVSLEFGLDSRIALGRRGDIRGRNAPCNRFRARSARSPERIVKLVETPVLGSVQRHPRRGEALRA